MGFIFSVLLSPCGISQPSDRRRHRQAFLRLQTTSEKVTQITGCMLLCDLDLTRSLFLPYCTSFILGRISFLFYYKRTSRKKYVGEGRYSNCGTLFPFLFARRKKKRNLFPRVVVNKLWKLASGSYREKEKSWKWQMSESRTWNEKPKTMLRVSQMKGFQMKINSRGTGNEKKRKT